MFWSFFLDFVFFNVFHVVCICSKKTQKLMCVTVRLNFKGWGKYSGTVSLSVNWADLNELTWGLQNAVGVKWDISRCPQLERAHTNSDGIILLRIWGPWLPMSTLELEKKDAMPLTWANCYMVKNCNVDTSQQSPAGCKFQRQGFVRPFHEN